MKNGRNLAIDMFRGVTMALMVTVNDFWSVHNVPHYLEHYATMEDGMGLSDVIYPMFLFAMGMSVPLALDRRAEKGLDTGSTLRHILRRTLALLLMGVFTVNAEIGVSSVLGYGKGLYWLLMVAGFFLVWNCYPKDFRAARPLKLCGAAILAFLAVTYRNPDGGLFQASWWGILGQIGWMYLFCACAYLLCRERKWLLAVLWGAFCLVNLSVAPMRDGGYLVGANLFADFSEALHLGNGHSIIMALGGMLTVLGERRIAHRSPVAKVSIGLGTALLLAACGLTSHSGWITSKGLGTLPWCLYSCAVSVAFYTLLRVLEEHSLVHWFAPLRTAGTATLSVYIIPYFWLSFWVFLNPTVPMWLGGWPGVLKCCLFSALCITTAWALGKAGIKLKV